MRATCCTLLGVRSRAGRRDALVLPQPGILDGHDLAADVPNDLPPPPVRLHHVVALRGQVRPLLRRAPGLICAEPAPLQVSLPWIAPPVSGPTLQASRPLAV